MAEDIHVIEIGHNSWVSSLYSYGTFANAQWVPHMLSKSEEKKQLVKIACKLLQRYSEEGDEMLQCIVAINETWIQSFEPKFK